MLSTFSTLTRSFVAGLAAFTAVNAQAHSTFLLPDADANGEPAVTIIFSDSLEPEDIRVVERDLPRLSLYAQTEASEPTALEHEPAEFCRVAELPGDTHVVFGDLTYGLFQFHGVEGDPQCLLSYYPKTLIGSERVTEEQARMGAAMTVEIVPVYTTAGVRFRFESDGEPITDAEMTVYLPDGTEAYPMSDEQGLSPVYTEPGRYGVTALRLTREPGDHEGEPYDALLDSASLVLDWE